MYPRETKAFEEKKGEFSVWLSSIKSIDSNHAKMGYFCAWPPFLVFLPALHRHSTCRIADKKAQKMMKIKATKFGANERKKNEKKQGERERDERDVLLM